ncbi:hypothetical protein ACN5ZK_02275 [Macrococcoides bohemicum]|uniref:hypothetical protein n=1 Tax=Macrococcoides bohemicum TaxID=1903056 RepID=UPI003AFFF8BD
MNNLKKNMSYNLIFTILSALTTFILMKYIFLYFNEDKDSYGLWLIVFSVLSYIYLMDFGLSNGLRNIITPLINNDRRKLNQYVSCNYTVIGIITLALILTINSVLFVLPFNFMENFEGFNIAVAEFKIFVIILINLQIIYFFFACVKPVFHSFAMSYLVNVAQFASNIVTIIIINILIAMNMNDNWNLLAFIYLLPQIVVVITISVIILKKFQITIKPIFNVEMIKYLMSYGMKFIFLQMSSLILLNSLPIIIGLLVTLTQASQYQLSYKMLSIFLMIFTVIMGPIWTHLLIEKEKNNYKSIYKITKKLFSLILVVSCGILVFGIFLNKIIFIWMGENFHISLTLSLIMCIYMIINIICDVMQSVLFGLNIFKVQIIGYLSGSIYLLLSSYLLYTKGVSNLEIVMLNGIISLLIPAVLMLIAYKSFISIGLKTFDSK